MNEYSYILKKKLRPAPDLLLLELEPSDGQVFTYKPGQYVMISFRNSQGAMEEKHAFSLASSPTQKGLIQLGIRIGGRFTRELADLPEGEKLVVYGPFGSFSFNEQKHLDAVFFAGGIGITPFMSAMRYATDKQLPNRLSLLCSNRTLEGTAFLDEISSLTKRNQNIKNIFCVTDANSPQRRSDVQFGKITLEAIQGTIISPVGKTFFLCGPLPFMNAMKNYLLAFGAREDQILMEEFAMLSSSTLAKKIAYAGNLIGWSVMAMLLPFYLIYAANTKTVSGEPILDKLFRDKDEQDAENQQAIIGEIQEHLPLADDKQATSGADMPINNQAGSVAGSESGAPAQAAAKSVLPRTATQVPVSTPRANKANPATPKAPSATVVPKPETGASSANETQAQANQANSAPTPTTGASGATTGTQPSTGQAATAPTPTTSASGVSPSGAAPTGSSYEEEDDD